MFKLQICQHLIKITTCIQYHFEYNAVHTINLKIIFTKANNI